MIRKMKLISLLCFSSISPNAFAGGFVEGTIISIGEDQESVENIQRGQEIRVCADEDGELFCGRSVVTTSFSEEKDVYQISMSNGSAITAAFDQKFFVEGEWIEASDLMIGSKLHHISGDIVTVESNSYVGIEPTYTFNVILFHNYFANGVLVHNVYGLGNGPYGQYHTTRRISDSMTLPKINDNGYAGACVRGAVGGAAGGFVKGITTNPTPVSVAGNVAGGAAGGCATGMAHHSYDRNIGNVGGRSGGKKTN